MLLNVVEAVLMAPLAILFTADRIDGVLALNEATVDLTTSGTAKCVPNTEFELRKLCKRILSAKRATRVTVTCSTDRASCTHQRNIVLLPACSSACGRW